MDEYDDTNEVIIRVNRIGAQRHDRWSLLAFVMGSASDILSSLANITEVGTSMALEHRNQLRYDAKFKEIVG